MESKEWWGNPDNAEIWIRRSFFYKKSAGQFFKKNIIDRIGNQFKTVLEVGAGDGHLIGAIKKYKVDCTSIDINPFLSEYVSEQYKIDTYIGEFINLPFKDNQFDLAFTHQVLQHAHPDEVQKAVNELIRVAKEVWLFEGWGEFKNNPHGKSRHPADGGTWYWDFTKLAKCYSVVPIGVNKVGENPCGIRLYKICQEKQNN